EIALQRIRNLTDLRSQLAIEVGTSKRLPQFINQFDRDAREIVDEIERVLDFVRDTGGQLTEGRKLLCLYQTVLCGTQILQRGSQFTRTSLDAFEQTNILDGYRCLVGESLDQRDLCVGKRLDFRLRESDDALRNSFAEHWDCEHCPKGEHFLSIVEC